jgi:hypothetical protein
MGLDQFAGVKQTKRYEWKTPEGETKVDEYQMAGPFEWRKHARLQEFMNTLYMERNNIENKWEEIAKDDGTDETYWNPISWNEIKLKHQDIDRLEKAIRSRYSEYFCEGGFMWGHEIQEEQRDYYREQDLEFVEFAREKLANDETVVYSCSW